MISGQDAPERLERGVDVGAVDVEVGHGAHAPLAVAADQDASLL